MNNVALEKVGSMKVNCPVMSCDSSVMLNP
jgi:hypothetical protein